MSHESGDRHVTMLATVNFTKPSGGLIVYPIGAQCLVAAELADSWIADKLAEPWPKPAEETPAAIDLSTPEE